MILERLIDLMFVPLDILFGLLPDISWTVTSDVFTKLFEVLRVVCYMLPMGTVRMLIAIVIAMTLFRIIISLIKTIWDLIPFM